MWFQGDTCALLRHETVMLVADLLEFGVVAIGGAPAAPRESHRSLEGPCHGSCWLKTHDIPLSTWTCSFEASFSRHITLGRENFAYARLLYNAYRTTTETDRPTVANRLALSSPRWLPQIHTVVYLRLWREGCHLVFSLTLFPEYFSVSELSILTTITNI